MKDQQRHGCSCAVCGRKRSAIEEELEVLYDAYYEELEQYAHHQQRYKSSGGTIAPPPGPGPFPGSVDMILPPTTDLVKGAKKPAPAAKAPVKPATKGHSPGCPHHPHHHTHTHNGRKCNGHHPTTPAPAPAAAAKPIAAQQYVEDEEDEDDFDDEDDEEDDEEEEEEDDAFEDEEFEDDEEPVAPAPIAPVSKPAAIPAATPAKRPPTSATAASNPKGATDVFGGAANALAAKNGGILTVADDLLKNDGQKFLEMMESLADKRIQREREAVDMIDDESEEDSEGSDDDYEDDEEEEEDEEEVRSGRSLAFGLRLVPNCTGRRRRRRFVHRRAAHGRGPAHVPDLCRPHVRAARPPGLPRKGALVGPCSCLD
jgi:hypothetical protein